MLFTVVYRGLVMAGTVSVCFEQVDHPAIARWVERFAAARQHDGFLSFDFVVDASGRPVATYPMETGDARAVRVVVPSYNVEALHARLRQMGDVETMAADPSVLYAAGADVPVAIDVQRE